MPGAWGYSSMVSEQMRTGFINSASTRNHMGIDSNAHIRFAYYTNASIYSHIHPHTHTHTSRVDCDQFTHWKHYAHQWTLWPASSLACLCWEFPWVVTSSRTRTTRDLTPNTRCDVSDHIRSQYTRDADRSIPPTTLAANSAST